MFNNYQTELILSAIVLLVLVLLRFFSHALIKKFGRKSGVNEARIKLISRYFTVTIVIIAILIEASIFGIGKKDLAVVFSSLFAVIGIGLFAVWSILSNITSGIILFISFPHKVGDKIKIHDDNFPVEAIIEDIRAFHLHLRLDNGDLVTYPNNLMLQKAVTLIQKDAIEGMEDGTDLI